MEALPGRAGGMWRLALGAVAPLVALAVVWHTLDFVLGHHPALPIADGWAPWSSLRQVLDGQTTPVQALVARHNEHRILVTRLLFLLDLLDGGRDRISTAASLAFQALQAAIWLALLRRTAAPPTMRWLVDGTVVAMLFTLRQGDNFVSGFQAQFTGVFALNVAAALLLLPGTVDSTEVRMPSRRRLAVATAGLLALPFTMANGLLAGPACAATGFLLRSRAGRLSALLALSASILSVILDRALPSDGTGTMTFALTPAAILHALTYIGGSVTSGRVPWALAAGTAGILSSLAMMLTVLRRGVGSRTEAVAVEAMLFALMSAGATAVGRVGAGFGVEQALSGRYATGSAAFWAATLVFWCTRLFGRRAVPGQGRGTAMLALGSILLLVFVVRDQHSYDRVLAEQGAAADRVLSAFRADEVPAAPDLLRIGVDLPTATADMALLRVVRAIDRIDAPSLPQGGGFEGRRSPGDESSPSEGIPSTGSSTVLPIPPLLP